LLPQLEGNMNEGPGLAWLALLILGIAIWAGVLIYALTRYRAWQDRRRGS
jgi:hypothetical protein